MINIEIFDKTEAKLMHLTRLWNYAEGNAQAYEKLFVSNPHEIATLIGQGTLFGDWQEFLTDTRIQAYIDRVIYMQAGIIVNKLMAEQTKLGVAEATKLNSAIKYRDDHKPDFAIPVQYIYIQTPLTVGEKEFLPNIPENDRPGV